MRKDPHIANIFSAEEEDCLSLEQMTAYQQGKLAGQDKHLVERHLLNCELCAITLESIAENGVEAIETGAAEVADMAWDRVQQRQNRKRRGAIFWIASAASIALLVTVGYFTMRQPSDDDYAHAFGEAIKNTPPMAVDGLKERDYAMAESPESESGVEAAKEGAPDEQPLGETKEVQPVAPSKTILPSTNKDMPLGTVSSGKDAIKGGSDLYRNDNMAMRESQQLGGASGKSVSKAPVSDYQVTPSAKPTAMPSPTPMAPKTTSADDGDQSVAGNEAFNDFEFENDELSVSNVEMESKSSKKESKRDRENAEDVALEDQVSGRAVSATHDKRLISAADKAPGSGKARSNISKEKNAPVQTRNSPSKFNVSEPTVAKASPVDQSYEQGLISYKEGDYREAARELRKATEQTPSNLDAHIFAADAFLRTSQPQAALFHIERVLAVPGNSHLEEAEWFKALAYLQLKDDAHAKPQLQKVIDGGGKFKGLAEKALAELK